MRIFTCMDVYTYYKDISRRVMLTWHTAVPRRLQLCAYVYTYDLVNLRVYILYYKCMYIIYVIIAVCVHTGNGTSYK